MPTKEEMKKYVTIRFNGKCFERKTIDGIVPMNDMEFDRFIMQEKDNNLKDFFEDFLRTHYSHYECYALPPFEIETDFVIYMSEEITKHDIFFKEN